MCKTKELEKQIASTAASLKKSHKQANQELSSPECYLLPLTAFLIGVTCHKALPSPMKIIALSMNLPLLHK